MAANTNGDVGSPLETVVRLLAANLVREEPSIAAKAQVLSRLGVPITDIATVCNTTPATIRTRLSEAKQGPKQKTKSQPAGREKRRAGGDEAQS